MEDIHRALDEIFAETPRCQSHQSIPQLTEVMIAAVEASAGRARKTTHVPFLVGHEKEARGKRAFCERGEEKDETRSPE